MENASWSPSRHSIPEIWDFLFFFCFTGRQVWNVSVGKEKLWKWNLMIKCEKMQKFESEKVDSENFRRATYLQGKKRKLTYLFRSAHDPIVHLGGSGRQFVRSDPVTLRMAFFLILLKNFLSCRRCTEYFNFVTNLCHWNHLLFIGGHWILE